MKQNQEFYDLLAKLETGGQKNPYSTVNRYGYVGKYQVGEDVLSDLGYYKKSNGSLYKNDWTGTFTGKNGVKSLDDFKKNPDVQEKVMRELMAKNWQTLKSNHAVDYIGKVVGKTVITPSGLLAGAHLLGAKGVLDYLKDPENPKHKDANGMHVDTYIREMGNCNVREETENFQYDAVQAENLQTTLNNHYEHKDTNVDFLGRIVEPVMWDWFKDKYSNEQKTSTQRVNVHSADGKCSGSYQVSGYKTNTGKEVDAYVRKCWKH